MPLYISLRQYVEIAASVLDLKFMKNWVFYVLLTNQRVFDKIFYFFTITIGICHWISWIHPGLGYCFVTDKKDSMKHENHSKLIAILRLQLQLDQNLLSHVLGQIIEQTHVSDNQIRYMEAAKRKAKGLCLPYSPGSYNWNARRFCYSLKHAIEFFRGYLQYLFLLRTKICSLSSTLLSA